MAATAVAGIAYTNPSAIKNRMMNYDAGGNWVNIFLIFVSSAPFSTSRVDHVL